MPTKTVVVTMHMRRLEDMCTTCWRSGMVAWHTTELKDTGVVVGRERTFCALCRMMLASSGISRPYYDPTISVVPSQWNSPTGRCIRHPTQYVEL